MLPIQSTLHPKGMVRRFRAILATCPQVGAFYAKHRFAGAQRMRGRIALISMTRIRDQGGFANAVIHSFMTIVGFLLCARCPGDFLTQQENRCGHKGSEVGL